MFSHRDHVGVAYEALAAHDFFTALAEVANGLQSLARRAGAAGKFNATITFAFMSLIAERMHSSPCQDTEDFINKNPDIGGRSLAAHYSRERLSSDLARRIAHLPD